MTYSVMHWLVISYRVCIFLLFPLQHFTTNLKHNQASRLLRVCRICFNTYKSKSINVTYQCPRTTGSLGTYSDQCQLWLLLIQVAKLFFLLTQSRLSRRVSLGKQCQGIPSVRTCNCVAYSRPVKKNLSFEGDDTGSSSFRWAPWDWAGFAYIYELQILNVELKV